MLSGTDESRRMEPIHPMAVLWWSRHKKGQKEEGNNTEFPVFFDSRNMCNTQMTNAMHLLLQH